MRTIETALWPLEKPTGDVGVAYVSVKSMRQCWRISGRASACCSWSRTS